MTQGEEHALAASRQNAPLPWVRRLLRLYPRAWRERYAGEVTAVLMRHPVTYWTALDLVLGAVDAHLHGDLLPGRLTSMAHRIRSSEIAIFCAFVLFCVTWLVLRLVRDPLPVWEAAVNRHPELLTALTIVDLAGIVATLALVVGGLPILVAALAHAITTGSWRRVGLFCVPLLAAAALVVYWIVAVPASGARQSNAPNAPLTPLAVALQLGLVLLVVVAVGGSAAAIAAAVGRSELDERMLRFALIPSGVAAAALALGLLGAIVLTALIYSEAPQVSLGSPVQVVDLLLMLVAVVLAGAAVLRGVRAARAG